jgi:hypothetical protein
MMRTGKLTLAAVTATMLVAIAVSNASARNLSTNERFFRIAWASFELNDLVFGVSLRCPMTMEGSFHNATIAKVLGSLIGNVTRAVVKNASCTGGHLTVLTERLPWGISYQGFTGRLPAIETLKILLIRPAFRIEATGGPFIFNCLTEPARINGIIRGALVGGNFKPETLAFESEIWPCGELSERSVGSGNITKLGSTERILITLI